MRVTDEVLMNLTRNSGNQPRVKRLGSCRPSGSGLVPDFESSAIPDPDWRYSAQGGPELRDCEVEDHHPPRAFLVLFLLLLYLYCWDCSFKFLAAHIPIFTDFLSIF